MVLKNTWLNLNSCLERDTHLSVASQTRLWHDETLVKQLFSKLFKLWDLCAEHLVIICYIISCFLYAYYIKAWSSPFTVQWSFFQRMLWVWGVLFWCYRTWPLLPHWAARGKTSSTAGLWVQFKKHTFSYQTLSLDLGLYENTRYYQRSNFHCFPS